MTASPSQKLPYSRIALAGLIAIVASIIANVLIWWLGGLIFDIPADFMALMGPGPAVMFTTVFLIGATLVYALITALSRNPPRHFTYVSIVAFVLLLIPDFVLLISPQSMPMGTTTVPAVLVLIAMHVAAYAITLWVFTRWAPRR